MGNSLSPILSNLFMEYFETQLVTSITDIKWLRYVDDIFTIWPENKNFDEFFQLLNSLHPNIKFKVEWEQNNTLSF